MTQAPFKVGLMRDLLNSSGQPSFGTGALEVLDRQAPGLEWEFIPEAVGAVTPQLMARYDAIYVGSARVDANALGSLAPRTRLIARHGVGYDSVDIAAMTEAGVLVTNTPVAVRRPVATMAITFVLALAQKLMTKDRLTRSGRWTERNDHMGQGLTSKVLGLIGAGSIGLETMRLARVFDMRMLAADPYGNAQAVAAVGGTLVGMDEMLAEADFVVVACLLNESTRHLVNAERLAKMKPGAYLINVARGPIVDEAALIQALQERVIAGAALDVFEQEPVDPANPLLEMEQVIVTPHALCWTDECFDAIARSGLAAVADVAARRVPEFLVNHAVLEHARVRDWLKAG